ncbi:putative Mediator of RNA polymerase II transcription subunit 19 [Hypsibius exemplaris]|uniref:Mediator of RNA polymerase II transcription subunit 19 n=1 Tax=Hypsibius exemplaris TaxID=2072580 RepID=A0A1W0WVR7_HYPEX|nr:putative Mediator of RNA polymerase II transcription subunit 19 [Hypsibius exemplaris]
MSQMSGINATAMPSPLASFRPDTTGTLKTTIMLGKNPSVLPSGPFYLIRADAIEESEISGSLNLLEYYDLESTYQKMALAKRPKEELSSFLPHLPGFLDTPASEDKSSLRDLWENPQRVRKDIEPLPPHLLNGFRLKPGPLPEKYRLMDINAMKKLHKKKRKKDEINGPDMDASPDAKKARKEKEGQEHRSKRKDKKRKRRDDHDGM